MNENLNFGVGFEALKEGKKVARQGWNGKYLTLVQGYPVNGHLNVGDPTKPLDELNPDKSKNITQGKAGQMLSHIVIKRLGESKFWGEGYSDYVPWSASQTAILAEDWIILN